jgi:hypothetical protein
MAHVMDFTSSLTELTDVNVTIRRWLYGTKELERKLYIRTISLCRYFDRIPEQSLSEYMDAFLEALDSEELESDFLRSEHLSKSIKAFVDHMKSSNDPVKTEKANLILDRVRGRVQIDH